MNKSTQQQIDTCPVCDSDAIDESIEDFAGVCTECGFVVHDPADTTLPEWIQSREEVEEQFHEDWLTVCRVRNSTEQQLARAFAALEDIGNALCLDSDLRQKGAAVYCDAFVAGSTDGRDTMCIIAACARLASLSASQPIPPGRLSELPSVDPRKYRLSLAGIQSDLGLSPALPTPEDYVFFLAGELDLEDIVLGVTETTLEQIEGHSALVGKDPVGITAAAIYLAAENKTQSEVADASGVSTETIRQRVNQLRTLVSDD